MPNELDLIYWILSKDTKKGLKGKAKYRIV